VVLAAQAVLLLADKLLHVASVAATAIVGGIVGGLEKFAKGIQDLCVKVAETVHEAKENVSIWMCEREIKSLEEKKQAKTNGKADVAVIGVDDKGNNVTVSQVKDSYDLRIALQQIEMQKLNQALSDKKTLWAARYSDNDYKVFSGGVQELYEKVMERIGYVKKEITGGTEVSKVPITSSVSTVDAGGGQGTNKPEMTDEAVTALKAGVVAAAKDSVRAASWTSRWGTYHVERDALVEAVVDKYVTDKLKANPTMQIDLASAKQEIEDHLKGKATEITAFLDKNYNLKKETIKSMAVDLVAEIVATPVLQRAKGPHVTALEERGAVRGGGINMAK